MKPARKRKALAILWNEKLDLRAALKKARIENRNLKRLMKGSRG